MPVAKGKRWRQLRERLIQTPMSLDAVVAAISGNSHWRRATADQKAKWVKETAAMRHNAQRARVRGTNCINRDKQPTMNEVLHFYIMSSSFVDLTWDKNKARREDKFNSN